MSLLFLQTVTRGLGLQHPNVGDTLQCHFYMFTGDGWPSKVTSAQALGGWDHGP